jgi:hypothetical protein
MGTKEFLKKVKKAKEQWEEGRSGRTGGLIEVDNGKYIVRGRGVTLDVNDDDVPYVQIDTIVVNADNEDDVGLRIGYRENIKHMSGTIEGGKRDGETWEITEADQFANICSALKSLGFETDNMDLEDLADVGDQMAEEQPACRVTVKTNRKDYKYIVWGKPVDDESLPAIEDLVEDEEEEDEEDVEEDEDVEDDEEEESDDDQYDEEEEDDEEEDDWEPVKGDEYEAQPKGTKVVATYTVTSINKRKKTCSLKRKKDGRLYKDQSWDVIQ